MKKTYATNKPRNKPMTSYPSQLASEFYLAVEKNTQDVLTLLSRAGISCLFTSVKKDQAKSSSPETSLQDSPHTCCEHANILPEQKLKTENKSEKYHQDQPLRDNYESPSPN